MFKQVCECDLCGHQIEAGMSIQLQLEQYRQLEFECREVGDFDGSFMYSEIAQRLENGTLDIFRTAHSDPDLVRFCVIDFPSIDRAVIEEIVLSTFERHTS